MLPLRDRWPHSCRMPGKRGGGEVVCACFLPKRAVRSALPTFRMTIDGVPRTVLVDSCCSCCLIFEPICKSWERRRVDVVNVNGEKQACAGVGRVGVCVNDSEGSSFRSSIEVDVCVMSFNPLGFDFVLGMNGITSLGGISISSVGAVRFGSIPGNESLGDVDDREETLCAGALAVEQNDFRVDYDASQKIWTAKWKWAGDKEPELLKNRVAEYSVPSRAREQFESELERWIGEGWLHEYDEREFGPAKGLIPLLAVIQDNKAKVRPVLDYREINSYVDAFTRDASPEMRMCAPKGCVNGAR